MIDLNFELIDLKLYYENHFLSFLLQIIKFVGESYQIKYRHEGEITHSSCTTEHYGYLKDSQS